MNRYPKILLALLAIALLAALTAPAQAGEIKGQVMSVDPDNLTFVLKKEASGKVVPFGLDEDAAVYINEEIRSIQDLRAGDEVSVVGRQEGSTWLAIEIRCERK